MKTKTLCILSHKPDSYSTKTLLQALTKCPSNIQTEVANPFCDLRYFDLENTLFWPRLGDWEFARTIDRLLDFESDKNIRWLNRPSLLKQCKNKLQTQQKFETKFPFPKIWSKEHAALPCVLKQLGKSQGRGVFLLQSLSDLDLYVSSDKAEDFFLQEYIHDADQSDYRVLLFQNKIIATMKRRNPSDFRSNISLGGIGSPADLTPKIQNLVIQFSKAVGLDLCGIDLILSPTKGPLILEINGTPGVAGIEAYVDAAVSAKISSCISEMTFFR